LIPRTLFSAEHELFRDQVHRFIAAEIMPYHAEWEKDGIAPRSAWLKTGGYPSYLLLTRMTTVPECFVRKRLAEYHGMRSY